MAEHVDTTKTSIIKDLVYARSRKAWNAGIIAAGGTLGAVSLTSFVRDGQIDGAAIGATVFSVVGMFAVTFVTVFFSTNAGK